MADTQENKSMEKTSCIKDMPIKAGYDSLDANGDAKALCKFIEHADTPVTIGMEAGAVAKRAFSRSCNLIWSRIKPL